MLAFYLSMLETEQERKRMSELYEVFQLTCFCAARGISKDDQLAEDAVHNAFMNLIRKKELLTLPDEELKALLVAIVKRRTIDLLREKERNRTERLDDMQSMPSQERPVEVQISTSEDFERLIACIESLNESHRSILQLKYACELSNTEIGAYLGQTNIQIKTQLYRAKLKLREVFCEDREVV